MWLVLWSLILSPSASAGECDAQAGVLPCASTSSEKSTAGNAWLGVVVQDLDEELREVLDIEDEFTGVVVAGVTDGSPADKAGIRLGDLIQSVSGKDVEAPDDLVELIRAKKPGSEVVVSVVRDGKKRRIGVTLGAVPAKKPGDKAILFPKSRSMWSETMPPLRRLRIELDRGHLGVNVQEVSGGLGEYFGVEEGVLVTEVLDGSAAEEAGMKAGDVITAIDGEKVADTRELTDTLGDKEDGETVEVSLVRKGKPLSLKVTLEKGPFRAWMEGIGEKGLEFKHDFIVPGLEDMKRNADLERRMEALSEELEKLKERLEELDEELGSR